MPYRHNSHPATINPVRVTGFLTVHPAQPDENQADQPQVETPGAVLPVLLMGEELLDAIQYQATHCRDILALSLLAGMRTGGIESRLGIPPHVQRSYQRKVRDSHLRLAFSYFSPEYTWSDCQAFAQMCKNPPLAPPKTHFEHHLRAAIMTGVALPTSANALRTILLNDDINEPGE